MRKPQKHSATSMQKQECKRRRWETIARQTSTVQTILRAYVPFSSAYSSTNNPHVSHTFRHVNQITETLYFSTVSQSFPAENLL